MMQYEFKAQLIVACHKCDRLLQNWTPLTAVQANVFLSNEQCVVEY